MTSHPQCALCGLIRTFEGCYRSHEADLGRQERIDPTAAGFRLEASPFGRGILTNGHGVNLRSGVEKIDGYPALLWLGIPIESLSGAYPVGAYPFPDSGELDWRKEVDAWLIDIARRVHGAHAIDLGLAGWEAGDLHTDPEPPGLARDVESNGVPAERWGTFLVPSGMDLRVFPCNTGPPMTFGERT